MQKPIDAMQLNYRIAAEYRHSTMQMLNPEAYRAAGDIMRIIDDMPTVDKLIDPQRLMWTLEGIRMSQGMQSIEFQDLYRLIESMTTREDTP